MTKKRIPSKNRGKALTAQEVGRFLKQFAQSLRDPQTGNTRMSEALISISNHLIGEKFNDIETAISKFEFTPQSDDDELNFEGVPIQKVYSILTDPNITKSQLLIIGTERFGIARSRMERLQREEIAQLIFSAAQHEESLDIISDEAVRGGKTRTS